MIGIITILGDLRCPSCRTLSRTPVNERGQPYAISPGRVDCPHCAAVFRVTADQARRANRRSEAVRSKDAQGLVQELMRGV